MPSALELVETLPSTPCVEPAVQFTQASLNVRIYLDGEPFPPSLDLQLKEGRLFEDPVRLPVTVSFEQKFAVKVASPMEGIVFPFPFMKRDGAKWLVDFDELCSAPRTPTEIPAVVHDDILNDLEDGFENGSVPTTCCVSADDVAAPPATLDGPIKLCEYETSEIEFAIFSNGSPYLSVCKVALIEHEVSGVWKKVLPVGIAPTTRRFEAGRSDSAELREHVELWGLEERELPQVDLRHQPPGSEPGALRLSYRAVGLMDTRPRLSLGSAVLQTAGSMTLPCAWM